MFCDIVTYNIWYLTCQTWREQSIPLKLNVQLYWKQRRQRKGNEMNICVKLSFLGFLVVRGSVSTEHGRSLFPPHFIPALGRGKWFGAWSTHIHKHVFWLLKTLHNCDVSVKLVKLVHRKGMMQDQQGCWRVEAPTTAVVSSSFCLGSIVTGSWAGFQECQHMFGMWYWSVIMATAFECFFCDIGNAFSGRKDTSVVEF